MLSSRGDNVSPPEANVRQRAKITPRVPNDAPVVPRTAACERDGIRDHASCPRKFPWDGKWDKSVTMIPSYLIPSFKA